MIRLKWGNNTFHIIHSTPPHQKSDSDKPWCEKIKNSDKHGGVIRSADFPHQVSTLDWCSRLLGHLGPPTQIIFTIYRGVPSTKFIQKQFLFSWMFQRRNAFSQKCNLLHHFQNCDFCSFAHSIFFLFRLAWTCISCY